MEKNDLTLKEVKEKLKKRLKGNEERFYLNEQDLKELDIIYKEIILSMDEQQKEGQFILPLKKGIGVIEYICPPHNKVKYFIPESLKKVKLKEDDVKELLKKRKTLQKELEAIDFLLEEERLRILFMEKNMSEQ